MAVEAFTGAACALELLLSNNLCCTYAIRGVEEEEGLEEDREGGGGMRVVVGGSRGLQWRRLRFGIAPS